MGESIKIRKLLPSDSPAIAKLHVGDISTGSINSRGIDFVTALYKAIAESKLAFGFMPEENDSMLGFVAFTTNLNKLYELIIVKN